MKIYDTLIIGSGYTSVGYAMKNKLTVICEEHQICDTHFYLPLRSFNYKPYTPKTDEARRLFDIFNSLSLFGEREQNTNGFECALCRYIEQNSIDLVLKCRIVSTVQGADGVYDVTVQTNEGLTHLFAKNILDTTKSCDKKIFTVLFVSDNPDEAKRRLFEAFENASIEPAFYKGRYALHIPVGDTDENRIKLEVYNKWRSLDIDAKILYMAPVFYGESGIDRMHDECYGNPIEACDSGYLYAQEKSNDNFNA